MKRGKNTTVMIHTEISLISLSEGTMLTDVFETFLSCCLATVLLFFFKWLILKLFQRGVSFKQFALEINETISQLFVKEIVLNESSMQFAFLLSFPPSIISPLVQVLEVMELLEYIWQPLLTPPKHRHTTRIKQKI